MTTPIRISVVMLTYNQAEYVGEAIASVFAQTHPVDEFIISDDGSNDGTLEAIQEAVKRCQNRTHQIRQVQVRQNNNNLGFVAHFNLALGLCSGDLVVYNAGDDCSLSHRVSAFALAYEALGRPRHFLGHSPVQIMNSSSGDVWTPPIARVDLGIQVLANASALHIGASQVFTPSLFHDFGPIAFEHTYEDLTLGFRALLTNAYHYIPEALVQYRTGGLSTWRKNNYQKKQVRFRDTLKQRSLDCLHANRPELLEAISQGFAQYGLGLPGSTRKINLVLWVDFQNHPVNRGLVQSTLKLNNVFDHIGADQLEGFTGQVQAALIDPSQLSRMNAAHASRIQHSFNTLYIHSINALRALQNTTIILKNQRHWVRTETTEFPVDQIMASTPELLVRCQNKAPALAIQQACESVDFDPLLNKNIFDTLPNQAILVPDAVLRAARPFSITETIKTVRSKYPGVQIVRLVDQHSSAATGFIDIEENNLSEITSKCRVIALLKETETLNTALLWGSLAAQGVVCICKNELQFSQWIQQGLTGLRVDDDATKWVMGLEMLLHNQQLFQMIQDRAQEWSYFQLNTWKQARAVMSQLCKPEDLSSFNRFYPL